MIKVAMKKTIIIWLLSVGKVYERHQILENSIGALPKEHEAYNTLLIIVSTCVPGLFVATILQFVLYYLFNRFFHPFKDIVYGPKKGTFIFIWKSYWFLWFCNFAVQIELREQEAEQEPLPEIWSEFQKIIE